MKRILISACLLGERCRYDGKSKPLDKDVLDKLKSQYILVPVCPEVMGGLSVPRKPCEICGQRVISEDGTDCTAEYTTGAEIALKTAIENDVALCILKSKSPSCGNEHIYDGSFSGTLKKGMGITAALLRRSGFAVFNETQIEDLSDCEQSLKTKYARDDASEKMIDLIRASRVFDLGYVAGGTFQSCGKVLANSESRDFASYYSKGENAALAKLKEFNKDYGKIE